MAEKRVWTPIKEYSDILFDYFEGIARITINRPQVYNAFRPDTNEQILDALDICRNRADIGVAVLTGAGDKAFCSGGDQNVKSRAGTSVPTACRASMSWMYTRLSVRCPNRWWRWSMVTPSAGAMSSRWCAT